MPECGHCKMWAEVVSTCVRKAGKVRMGLQKELELKGVKNKDVCSVNNSPNSLGSTGQDSPCLPDLHQELPPPTPHPHIIPIAFVGTFSTLDTTLPGFPQHTVNVFGQANWCCLAKASMWWVCRPQGPQAGLGAAGTLPHLLQRLALSRAQLLWAPEFHLPGFEIWRSVSLHPAPSLWLLLLLAPAPFVYWSSRTLPGISGQPGLVLGVLWLQKGGQRIQTPVISLIDMEGISNSLRASVSPSYKMGTIVFIFLPLADLMKLKWNHRCEGNQEKGCMQIHHCD